MIIGIIGAGASGMAAALAAAENPNAQIILLERQSRVGRKLAATGNGRCNLTNLQAASNGYHGEDAAFAVPALESFSPGQTLEWFHSLGLFTVAEPSGRVYPYSDQANSVVDVLRFALNRPNITLKTAFEVEKITKQNDGFAVYGNGETYSCHKLIIACGGLAGTKLGGSLSGYKLLSKLGHRSTRLRPALVQLKSSWGGVAALKGVRTHCHVQILQGDKLHSESTGELQFTEYGLSGPVIFEVSRDVCLDGGRWTAKLDFLPDITDESLYAELLRRRETNLPGEELLTGILHNRLGKTLLRASGGEVGAICKAVKEFEVELTEPLGMDSAQATAGGVKTDGFDPYSMESRYVPGLYACGEVLDIDGDCGGYNLQWAWSSGRCAGLHAGREGL